MTLRIPIAFDEAMLRALLSGGVVTVKDKRSAGHSVEIILSDIGWYPIGKALHEAKEMGRADWTGDNDGTGTLHVQSPPNCKRCGGSGRIPALNDEAIDCPECT